MLDTAEWPGRAAECVASFLPLYHCTPLATVFSLREASCGADVIASDTVPRRVFQDPEMGHGVGKRGAIPRRENVPDQSTF